MPIIPPFINGFPWPDPIFRSVQPFTYRDGTTYLEILRALDEYVKVLAEKVNETLENADTNLREQIEALVLAVNEALIAQAEMVNDALTAQQQAVSEQLEQQNAAITAQLEQQNIDVANQLAQQALDIANQLAAQDASVAQQLAEQTAAVQAILEALQNESIDFSDPVLTAIVKDSNTSSRALLDATYAGRRVHVVVGMGQSNMSGRGMNNDNPAADAAVSRIYQFGWKDKTLRLATDPLDMIDTPPGIGPLLQFARHLKGYVANNDIIVVIPAAEGGRPLTTDSVNSWKWGYPNGLSQRTVTQIHAALDAIAIQWPDLAIEISTFLWHQGEADAGSAVSWITYRNELIRLINGFRGEFGADIPFISGQLVRSGVDADNDKRRINHAHAFIPYWIERTGFAVGNYDENGDNHHYNREGQVKLARNYFSEWLRIIGGLRPQNVIEVENGGRYVYDLFATNGPIIRDASNLGWLFTAHSGSSVGNASLLRVNAGGVEPVDTANGTGTVVYMTMDPRNRAFPDDPTYQLNQTIKFDVKAYRNRTTRMVFLFSDYLNYMALEINAPATGGGATNYGISSYVNGVRTSWNGDLSVLTGDQVQVNVGSQTVRAFVDGRREIGFGSTVTVDPSLRGNSRAGYRFAQDSNDRMGPLYIEKYQAQ